ncbi:hypothetical protein PV797_21525 [Clostridiaceae bacterium M8S5]|nr:hypothetical protein PV797_21525 [Clostridiaceae bacterium M8S5]
MYSISTELLNRIKEILNTDISAKINVPKLFEHGHMMSNIALKYSSANNIEPIEVYNKIKSNICYDKFNIDKMEFKEPGFINFVFTNEWFKEYGYYIIDSGLINENSNLKVENKRLTDRAYIIKRQMDNIMQLKGIDKKVEVKKYDVKPFVVDEIRLDKIETSQLFFYACCRNRSTHVKIKKICKNDLSNPYKYMTYVGTRVNNIIDRLSKEGYDWGNIISKYLFEKSEVREIFKACLSIDTSINEAIKNYEPYKVFAVLKQLCDIFYSYNSKLLIRDLNKEEIEIVLFVLKVFDKIYFDIVKLLMIV